MATHQSMSLRYLAEKLRRLTPRDAGSIDTCEDTSEEASKEDQADSVYECIDCLTPTEFHRQRLLKLYEIDEHYFAYLRRKANQELIFFCIICQEDFETNLEMRQHECEMHPKERPSVYCRIRKMHHRIPKSWKRMKGERFLKEHCEDRHPGEPVRIVTCSYCDVKFMTEKLLAQHRSSSHEKPRRLSEKANSVSPIKGEEKDEQDVDRNLPNTSYAIVQTRTNENVCTLPANATGRLQVLSSIHRPEIVDSALSLEEYHDAIDLDEQLEVLAYLDTQPEPVNCSEISVLSINDCPESEDQALSPLLGCDQVVSTYLGGVILTWILKLLELDQAVTLEEIQQLWFDFLDHEQRQQIEGQLIMISAEGDEDFTFGLMKGSVLAELLQAWADSKQLAFVLPKAERCHGATAEQFLLHVLQHIQNQENELYTFADAASGYQGQFPSIDIIFPLFQTRSLADHSICLEKKVSCRHPEDVVLTKSMVLREAIKYCLALQYTLKLLQEFISPPMLFNHVTQ
ncbi:MAG: hypothetical protein M1827_000271 [Pycnora praestabilis]|nr:MAG: hypothetical protein M1827_000271 [Pycnora praestabilis]